MTIQHFGEYKVHLFQGHLVAVEGSCQGHYWISVKVWNKSVGLVRVLSLVEGHRRFGRGQNTITSDKKLKQNRNPH